MDRMKGRVALITGAARGIGAATARRFVEEGALVLLTDLLDAEGEALARSLGANARYLHHDVTRAEDWARATETVTTAFGGLNVLVNNAGILAAQTPIEQTEESDFRRVMDVNVVSVFLGMKAAAPAMKASGPGAIINLSSVAGIIGTANTAAYTASKFAVRGLTKSLAMELAEFGIRVNSVHPGYVDTKMIADMIPAEHAEAFRSSASPLGRLARPIEIANMVLFLASEESSYATGSEFIVDGGFTCH